MTQASAPPDPLVGKTLDNRFKIIERLGAGGMGTVYKAIQEPLDRLVALKILNANYDSKRDPGFQRRFFLEASVTSKLKHPNTITVIDYGKTVDNIYYLAMEYVAGVTLAQVLIAGGPLPWSRCLNIAQQICRSLREAHKAGIIHRDLKPANVMICNEETESDIVKVLDFGLVKPFLPDSPHALEGGDLTQAGVFLGSPLYMAPEQARNLADPRSDIYSLGVVMFQTLMGRPPFTGEQSLEVILKHIKEPPPTFRMVRPDLQVPKEVEDLVMRCLQKDPAQRFQTMDEMLDGIRRVIGAISGPNPKLHQYATPPPIAMPSSPRIAPAEPAPTPGSATVNDRAPASQRQASGDRAPSGQRRPPSGQRPAIQPPLFSGDPYRAAENLESQARAAERLRAGKGQPRPARPYVVFVASAALGLGAMWLLSRSELTVPDLNAAPTVDAGPRSATPQVRFRIRSDPPGAKVAMDGKALGITPLDFTRTPGRDGIATAKLVFTLEGYETLTSVAAGSGVVTVAQPMRKLASKP